MIKKTFKQLDSWIKWKKEDKRNYYSLIHSCLLVGFYVGIVFGVLVINFFL